MRTIFDSMIVNRLFAHSLCGPRLFGDPAYAPQWQSTFILVVGTVLDFEELHSTLYLVSYSFDYSTYIRPFSLGASDG